MPIAPRSRITSILLPLVLASTGMSAGDARAQEPLRCGTRDPIRYTLVLDVSSSMRDNRAEATDAYADIIATLTTILCRGDSLDVLGFPSTGRHRMEGLAQFGAPLSRSDARALAVRVLESGVRHTDLTMVLQSIRKDIRADVVFMATDGSFYPSDVRSVSYRDLQDRLHDFTGTAAPPSEGPAVYAIGVRSNAEFAIDRDLSVDWPVGAGAWTYLNEQEVNLRSISGTELLKAAFGGRFQAYGDGWLHALLFDRGRMVWEALGYESPARVHLRDIQTASIEHLLFIPPDGAEAQECPALAAPTARPRVQRVITAPSGRSGFCSLAAPSPEDLSELEGLGVTRIVYRQGSPFDLSSIPGTIYGFHQIVAGLGDQRCTHRDVRTYLQRGEPWPPRGSKEGVVEIRPLSAGGLLKTLDLVRLPGTPCLVAQAPVPSEWDVDGPHLLYLHREGTTAVRPIVLGRRRVVAGPSVRRRDGGFILGPGSRLSTCVELSQPLAPDEMLTLLIPGREHPLTDNHDPSSCALPEKASPDSPRARYVFSSVVVPNAAMHSGYLFLGSRADSLAQGQSTEWYPLTIVSTGRFYLSWLGLVSSFLLGVVLQMAILAWENPQARGRVWTLRPLRHVLGRMLRAGFITVLVCGAFMAAWATEWSGVEMVPLSLLLGVVGCLIKLVVSLVLPALYEEGLTN